MSLFATQNKVKQQAKGWRTLLILLPLLWLAAAGLLAMAWQNTSQVIDSSINYQMQEAQDRAQSRLDSYLAGLDNLLANTAEDPQLADALQQDERRAAKNILQNTLNHNYGEYLDLLLLTRQEQYWTNVNSPLYLLGNHLNTMVVDTPYFNKWSSIELAPNPSPLMAIVQRYPILANESGMVIGSLFGGLILNDNLTLLSLLGAGTKDKSLQIIVNNQTVGPTFKGADIDDTIFERILASQQTQGKIEGHYFSLQTLLINGSKSKLQLLLVSGTSMSQQFEYAYLYHLLLALVLGLIAMASLIFFKQQRQ